MPRVTPHTPGPLQVILREQGTYNVERVSDGIRSVLAICYDSLVADEHGGSAYGNATLFAAAPELVARVQARAARCLCHVSGATGRCTDCQADHAALARAKGE